MLTRIKKFFDRLGWVVAIVCMLAYGWECLQSRRWLTIQEFQRVYNADFERRFLHRSQQ